MIKINYNMSTEEIEEYMKVYTEMMLDVTSWKEDDTRFEAGWYKKYLATGILDKRYLSDAQELKLKNKRYQLKKGNLDQSFIIWRLMKQEQDKINIKLAEALKQNKIIGEHLHLHALSIKR
jgi:hypothetical protein